MRRKEIKPSLQKILNKLSKKDKDAYIQILKKIIEIINCENPDHYKNLKEPLQKFKRSHIKKSFVLVFSFDETLNLVNFIDYDHHDNIYKKRLES